MSLAQSGRPLDGLAVLKAAQAGGDPASFLLEGLWLLEGRFLPRDSSKARSRIGDAAERGHVGAARTPAGLMACGVGAPADWPAGLAMLEEWSSRDPIAARQRQLLEAMDVDDCGRPHGGIVETDVGADPRMKRFRAFLTSDECTFLIELADPRMKRATIFNEAEQKFVADPIRRSDKAGFPIVSEWPFVRALNLRIAAATRTDVDCGEPLQVLRYGADQEYRPHADAIPGMANPRVLTALVWLNEDFVDGETIFPELDRAERGRIGDLLLFTNTLADGSPDPEMVHAGARVTSGVKYMASRWIRAKPPGEEGFGPHEVERC